VIIEALRLEFRAHRMARFAVWIAAYGAALWLVECLTGSVPGLLWFLFWASFIPSAIYYLVRGIGYVRHRLLWRLRRRLIVAYIFIAVVPILLIVLLAGLGAFIVNGQFAAFLVTSRLRESSAELKQVNRAVIHEARLTERMPPDAMLERIRRFYVSELREHQ
jgi:nitrogen fixation/metabolism regulation signal transduction histidine kinase